MRERPVLRRRRPRTRLQAAELAARIEAHVTPQLRGIDVTSFQAACERVESLALRVPGLGRAAAYGLSQAVLDAASHAAGHHTMGRVITDEWGLSGPLAPVPLCAQTGEDRDDGVDKMLLERVPVLPHGLINTPDLVGPGGGALVEYFYFIRNRLRRLARDPTTSPPCTSTCTAWVGAEARGAVPATADEWANTVEDIEAFVDAGAADLIQLKTPDAMK